MVSNNEGIERRDLLCLRFAKGDAVLKQTIESAGWCSHAVLDAGDAMQVVKRREPKVGLVYFDGYYLNGGSTELEALLQSTADMEWVGLIDPHDLRLERTQELIANYLSDYHTLPIDGERLLNSLGHAYGMADLRHRLCKPGAVRMPDYQMVAVSRTMLSVFEKIERIAAADASVMIGGESGTGKELAARAIHSLSRRADGPFVAVNCGSIPPSLVQTELFGHEKGAFSGAHRRNIGRIESAAGGTLFLDEIGDLPLELQVNLLRFLQEKVINRVGGNELIPVDVRVITASHMDLGQAVESGSFRRDLYYRLHVLSLRLPSLRERHEDVRPLAEYFLRRFQDEAGHRLQGFTPAAVKRMEAYDWPGNVRELINRVERAVVMCRGTRITPEDLEFPVEPEEAAATTLAQSRADAELRAIRHALRKSGNNITEAARRLKISRVTLYRLMDKVGIVAKDT